VVDEKTATAPQDENRSGPVGGGGGGGGDGGDCHGSVAENR
jgi:hypothetical protein